MTNAPIVVVAAVVKRDDVFLAAQRLPGTHRAGLWEFPGGKCEPGESHVECLIRELREELGATARVGAEMFVTRFAYSDRSVELHFYECQLAGEPRPLLGQPIRWVTREELRRLPFLEADAAFIEELCAAK